MAINQVFDYGDSLSLPVPEGVTSGDPVAVGALVGIALTDRDDDGEATVRMRGVYSVEVAGAATVGGPVYIEDGALTTSEGGTLWGHAISAKTAATAVIPVKIARV